MTVKLVETNGIISTVETVNSMLNEAHINAEFKVTTLEPGIYHLQLLKGTQP